MDNTEFLLEQLVQSADRIAVGVGQLTDRQRVSAEATNVFFHGIVPTSPTYVYFASASSVGTIRDLRFQNIDEANPTTISIFLVDWKQLSKQNTGEFPNLGEPVSIQTSDLVYRRSVDAGQHLGESVNIVVPPLWILALRANGQMNGHISGIELLTL